MMPTESGRSDTKNNYQPIPDGRFYTKANFFTMNDRNEADLLSSDGGGDVLGPNMGGAVPFPTY